MTDLILFTELFLWEAIAFVTLIFWMPAYFRIGGYVILFACFIGLSIPLSPFAVLVVSSEVVSLIFRFIFKSVNEKTTNSSPFRVTLTTDKKRKVVIEDINRGVSIFGASGSGKSAGPIYQIASHLAKNRFAGVIHDYKDYELTKVLYPVFQKDGINFHVWAPHDVERSVRINPIAARYIETEKDVMRIVSTLFLNLFSDKGGDSSFFIESAESLLSAVIWRYKESFPEKCNLPSIISYLLSGENLHESEVPYGKLIQFIKESKRAEILGSMFLTGIANERQTASVMSTLSQGLRKLASPEMFYLLSADEFDLALNRGDNRNVLSIINEPKNASFITPINAMVMECVFTAMSEHGRAPAFVLLDEARSIRLNDLGQKVATLRSYNISFIYALQDRVQAQVIHGGKDYYIKEILSNLSVQFFGKINDPDSGKFYENYFEMVKEKQTSHSKGVGSWLREAKGEDRVNTSFRDVAKFRGFDFFKLTAGEFVMFSGGKAERFRFFYERPGEVMPVRKRDMTKGELEGMYGVGL